MARDDVREVVEEIYSIATDEDYEKTMEVARYLVRSMLPKGVALICTDGERIEGTNAFTFIEDYRVQKPGN